jgi:hypothetical protein
VAGEEATLRGYVIGEEGKPVAGWVSLGLEQPQRWLAHNVRIETDDGYEVTIEELAGDSIVPVTKLDVKWGDIAQDEVAALCYREAPAADAPVQFRDAILRGGDPIVVWGEVADHGYAGGADTQSPAYRGGGQRTISRLQARVVAYGENCEQFFHDAQARWVAKHAIGAVALPQTRSKQMTSQPMPELETAAPVSDRDYRNRIAHNLPLVCSVVVMLGALAVGIVTHQMARMMLAVAAAACAPIACDAWLVGGFRRAHLPSAPLEVPVVGYLVCAVATIGLAVAMSLGDVDADKAEGLRAFSYLFAIGAVVSTSWLWAATRKRRAWVSIMHKAPAHREPLRDGVWGASDGTFASEVMSIGEMITEFGTAVKSVAGLKSRTVKTETYANLTYEAELMTDAGRRIRRVRLAEASILTMVHLDRRTGGGKGIRADVITARTPVRLVGRPQNGLFTKSSVVVKSGEASLLVFASGIGTNVASELRRLYRRDWIGQVLGAVGVVCLVVSFLL